MSLYVWRSELSATWSLGKWITWKVLETREHGCRCYFYLFRMCIFPGQWLTGIKAQLVNWSIITDQNENCLVELLGLWPYYPTHFLCTHWHVMDWETAEETRHRRQSPFSCFNPIPYAPFMEDAHLVLTTPTRRAGEVRNYSASSPRNLYEATEILLGHELLLFSS